MLLYVNSLLLTHWHTLDFWISCRLNITSTNYSDIELKTYEIWFGIQYSANIYHPQQFLLNIWCHVLISTYLEYFGFLPNIRCHVLWCTYCTCDIWISGVKLCTAHILNGITPRSTLEVGATRPMDKLSCLLWNLAFVCLCFPIILPSSLLLVLCYFLNGKYLLNQAWLTWSSRAVDARSLVLLRLMLPSQ